jgi:hypothetical protein
MGLLIIFLLFVSLGLLVFSVKDYIKTKKKYNKFMKEKDKRETN